MLQTLIFITFKQWRAHKLRLAFTLLGIALGVAVLFAIRTANLALLGSLNQTIEKLAGKATLQVTANESGVPEDLLDAVRDTPGVRIAEPAIEVLAQTAFDPPTPLMVVGVDTVGSQELHEYTFDQSQTDIGDPLVYLSEPFSVLVSRKFAAKHGLKEDDKLRLHTSRGEKEFTIRGVFEPIGVGAVFDGQIASMDVYSAQFVFGRGRTFDRIDILTEPGVEVETVLERLRKALPAGVEVERPAARGKAIENVTTAMRHGFTITSLVALIVGVFIIFNSFTISVNQRWKEIGILRSLGVERFNVTRMFLMEAVLVGLIGSALGVAGGFLLAEGVVRFMGDITSSIYGYATSYERLPFRIDYALTSLGIGVGASLLAVWLPARSASQLNPILALHNIEIRRTEGVVGWKRAALGAAIIAGSLLAIRFTPDQVGSLWPLGYAVTLLVGNILVLPKLTVSTAKALRPVTDRLFGSEGVLAVDSLIRSPRRTTATIGALMIGLMFVFATGAYVYSYKRLVVRWMDRSVNSDFIVKPTSDTARSRSFHFNEDLAKRFAHLPGVKRVENVRFTTVPFRGDTPAVVTIEMDGWFARATPDLLDEGDLNASREPMIRGEGVMVSKNFTVRWKLGLGDILRMDTPKGVFERPILGVMEDFTSEKGTLFMDRALYIKYWEDSAVDFVDVNVLPGTDIAAFKSRLEKVLVEEKQRGFVYTNGEYKSWIMTLIDGFFALNYMQMMIAVFVAALGIFNTLSISVSERSRELGVIRAVGGLRRQVRKIVLLEAVMIALTGMVAGVVAGALFAYFTTRVTGMILAGFAVPFAFPPIMVLAALPLIVGIAVLAAWWPSERAVRLNVIEAIGYE